MFGFGKSKKGLVHVGLDEIAFKITEGKVIVGADPAHIIMPEIKAGLKGAKIETVKEDTVIISNADEKKILNVLDKIARKHKIRIRED